MEGKKKPWRRIGVVAPGQANALLSGEHRTARNKNKK
jgi:hypothetical protein